MLEIQKFIMQPQKIPQLPGHAFLKMGVQTNFFRIVCTILTHVRNIKNFSATPQNSSAPRARFFKNGATNENFF